MTERVAHLSLPGYRPLRVLGRGAMGEVWEVEDLGHHRRAAIKVLHPSLATDETFIRRFRREARATSRLAHPGIVELHHFGQMEDGRYYLAMEFVEGGALDRVLHEEGPLEVARAWDLLVQLIAAMVHAHACEVVHRDLKPGNIMIARDDSGAEVVKVLDFGIAKIVGSSHGDTAQVTLRGEIIGTPTYMAPETWQGQRQAAAVDIYAIGCIAYELLSGRPPFHGGRMDVMHQHLTATPAQLFGRVRGLTAEQSDLIMACLEKAAEARPPSGAALLARFAQLQAIARPRGRVIGPDDVADDFGDETAADPTRESPLASGIDSTADTERRFSSAEHELHHAVVEAAETLLDRGAHTPRLALMVAKVRDAEGALALAEAQAAAVDDELRRYEALLHERERSLRFAVAELSFDHHRVSGGADPELDREIAEIGARLASLEGQAQQGRDALIERQIAMSADQATAADELAEAIRSLAAQVRLEAPASSEDPVVGKALRLIAALDRTRMI